MEAVIAQALEDLQNGSITYPPENVLKKDIHSAMYFIFNERCKAWCYQMGLNYTDIKNKAIELYCTFLENDFLFRQEKALLRKKKIKAIEEKGKSEARND